MLLQSFFYVFKIIIFYNLSVLIATALLFPLYYELYFFSIKLWKIVQPLSTIVVLADNYNYWRKDYEKNYLNQLKKT